MDEGSEDEYDSLPDGLLYVFHQDRLLTFDRATSKSFRWSYFGGPFDGRITGASYGPKPLHHVATLHANQVGVDPGVGLIPLVYGMCFDGCKLAYEFDFESVQIEQLEPNLSDESWPYPNYPAVLPYFELDLMSEGACDWARFEYLFVNQPTSQPADLIAVVPPPFDIGVSLWGRHGDLEGVELVFECDLKKQAVKATNKCT